MRRNHSGLSKPIDRLRLNFHQFQLNFCRRLGALAAALERYRASTHPPHLAVAPQARGSLAVGLFVVLGSAILSALIALLIGRAL